MSSSEREASMHRLETSAVRSSLWLGGVGLAGMKGAAYYLSGSSLVRAGMFESLGDVVSSAIMSITQWKVADESDRHLYPAGKQRLTPLGILFFCAFMTSTMVSLIIESISAITGSEEATGGPEELLRRVFDEQESLRKALPQEKVDSIVATYADASADDPHKQLVFMLLILCVGVKGALYLWCKHVSRVANSDIARTLGMDHFNDTLANVAITIVLRFVTFLEARGFNSPWMSKIDPAATLLMSLWILWNWVDTALEQVRLLSNRRVEDEEDVKKVAEAAKQHLEGSLLQLHRIDVYHSGESFEVRMEVFSPKSQGEKLGVEEVSTALHELETAVCDADVGVSKAHAKLMSGKNKSNGKAMDASWVAGYTTP